MVRFYQGHRSEAFKRELANSEDQLALVQKHRQTLLEAAKSRGDFTHLPDMTPAQVCALGKFIVTDSPLGDDSVFVEVLDGPHKGRFFWTSRFSFRVPGAKGPELGFGDLESDHKEEKPKPVPAPRPTANLLIEDSSWNQSASGSYVQVHCRVRNLTNEPIEGIRATIVFQDASGKMVYSSFTFVGTLRPGEAKTFSSMDKYDSRMYQYNFEFQTGSNSLTFTTTPSKVRRNR
jgi:hypothetical protein